MTLRRYAPMKKSAGTVIPAHIRATVLARDGYACVGAKLGWTAHRPESYSVLTLDHVRASHGMGMKSETVASNLVALCSTCHRWRTENGRLGRSALLAYLSRYYPEAA